MELFLKILTLFKIDFAILKKYYKTFLSTFFYIVSLILIFMILTSILSIFFKPKNSSSIVIIFNSNDEISYLITDKVKKHLHFIKQKKVEFDKYINLNPFDIALNYNGNILKIYIPASKKNDLLINEITELIKLEFYNIINKSSSLINKNNIQTKENGKYKNNKYINGKNQNNIYKNNTIFKVLNYRIKLITPDNYNQLKFIAIIVTLFITIFISFRIITQPAYFFTFNQKYKNNLIILKILPLKNYLIIFEKISVLSLIIFLVSFTIFSIFILLFHFLFLFIIKISIINLIQFTYLSFIIIYFSLNTSIFFNFLGFYTKSNREAKIYLFYIPMLIGLILSIQFGFDLAIIKHYFLKETFLDFIPLINCYEIGKAFFINNFEINKLLLNKFLKFILSNLIFNCILLFKLNKIFSCEKLFYTKQ